MFVSACNYRGDYFKLKFYLVSIKVDKLGIKDISTGRWRGAMKQLENQYSKQLEGYEIVRIKLLNNKTLDYRVIQTYQILLRKV